MTAVQVTAVQEAQTVTELLGSLCQESERSIAIPVMTKFTVSNSTRNRRCPKCGRGMAMQHDHETGGRFCRWCGYETKPTWKEPDA